MSVDFFSAFRRSAKAHETRSAIPAHFMGLTQKKNASVKFTPLRREKIHKCFVSKGLRPVIISTPKIRNKFFAIEKNNKKSTKSSKIDESNAKPVFG